MPPYRQIAEIIRQQIKWGDSPMGCRIPTESEILDVWEVARSTARRAIALHRDEGLVQTVPPARHLRPLTAVRTRGPGAAGARSRIAARRAARVWGRRLVSRGMAATMPTAGQESGAGRTPGSWLRASRCPSGLRSG
ncbi:MAG TPA: GntR family transcriptional regulator [Streptosporangiaceae bacterium]|nr:GntR family transcriptional regulator [Streptosporangiaceae bacterium]